VTSFFRDPEVFESLKRVAFPEIAKRKPPGRPYRIWVPGCSTGQEAYSIAMSLVEFHDALPNRPVMQIFATDLSDAVALDRARGGLYPDSIEAEVSPERLRRFFRKEDGGYRIDKSIRDMCVFARQNLAADPPFSHLDLISCRNVLIYLGPTLQRRVLPIFHYALEPFGFLLLGTTETVGDSHDLFESVDRVHKIYTKKPVPTWPALRLASRDMRVDVTRGRHRIPVTPPTDYPREADRILLGRFAPPAVLVDLNFDVIQFRGRTGAYLETPPGEPTTSVLRMAKEGLFLELRSALSEAKKTGRVVRRKGVRLLGDTDTRELMLEILPVAPTDQEPACFLVVFHDAQARAQAAAAESVGRGRERRGAAAKIDTVQAANRELERLRAELTATKEYMQSLAEQQEAANEELRSANEEILSSNEELQSTNEELETAKEELESTNEELTTVNDHRNAELTLANNDLINLLSSTDIPLVMIGSDRRIRRFTGAARQLMHLLPTDVGRPVGDIRAIADIENFDTMVSDVIEHGQISEREFCDRDGRWRTLRVSPYRTLDNRIEGAVVLMVDIDQIRRDKESLRQTTVALEHADRQKDQFLAILAHELRNPIAPLKNAVEILRMTGDDPATIAQVREVMDRQIRQLSGIVDDLIDISRIVEGKIDLKIRRTRFDEIVRTAVDTSRTFIEACRHELVVELPKEAVYLDADPVRVSQVVANLLNNAAKFTPSGGRIFLSARAASEEGLPGSGFAVIRVRDTGVGIASESAARIFEMFEQGSIPEHGIAGLGVGLTLVRSLVHMHGGTIEARSEGPGTGSEFIVRLPLADLEVPEPGGRLEPVTSAELNGPADERILVVDDNRDQADSLAALLRLNGHDVRVSYDGEDALRAAADFRPDVILLDLGLPKISGYQVAERITHDPRSNHPLLIAQTGWGQERDRERSRKAGFQHHLVKPVEVAEVLEILARARKRNRG
jgi:two-component system CheB/CheR fusion protein